MLIQRMTCSVPFKMANEIISPCFKQMFLQIKSKSLVISSVRTVSSMNNSKQVTDKKLSVMVGLPFEKSSLRQLQVGKLCTSSAHLESKFNTSTQSDFNTGKSEDNKAVDIGEGSWEEVYKGVLTAQFKLLKMFSIGSSVLGLCMQPILFEQIGSANLGLVVAFGSFIGFFTFASPCLIHYISKKYVTKLEYDSKSDVYAATTLSFFLKEKKIHFKADEVIRPDVPGMFTSFVVKEKSLFVDPHQFDDLDHYSRIMGYDKPIDFRLDSEKNKDS